MLERPERKEWPADAKALTVDCRAGGRASSVHQFRDRPGRNRNDQRARQTVGEIDERAYGGAAAVEAIAGAWDVGIDADGGVARPHRCDVKLQPRLLAVQAGVGRRDRDERKNPGTTRHVALTGRAGVRILCSNGARLVEFVHRGEYDDSVSRSRPGAARTGARLDALCNFEGCQRPGPAPFGL